MRKNIFGPYCSFLSIQYPNALVGKDKISPIGVSNYPNLLHGLDFYKFYHLLQSVIQISRRAEETVRGIFLNGFDA